jgi:CheY-like chemotaxis protein
MDCQMPDMDGYETTRRMRAVLHRYIPVVAITANAMVDDKQRCLDAGMDDFLPKPFTKSALSDLLCKWLVPGANAIADGDIAERITELPTLAAPVFDELWQSLQWRLSPLRKIYESFLSVAHETLDLLGSLDVPAGGSFAPAGGSFADRSVADPRWGFPRWPLGRRSVAPGDTAMLARRLHTLLGSAGMVGARQVERVTAWLAEAVKADRRAEFASGRALLAETVRRFETELERRLDSLTR